MKSLDSVMVSVTLNTCGQLQSRDSLPQMWAESLENPLRARMWGGFQASGFWQVFKVHLTNTNHRIYRQKAFILAATSMPEYQDL
jgi:hypothetical protein